MRDVERTAGAITRRITVVRGLLLGALLATCPPAHADPPAGQADTPADGADQTTREQCFQSHDQSQVAMRKNQFLAAKSSLLVCSRPACPALLRGDCLEWYADVERSIPSVVFAARRGNQDLFDVRVTVDGTVFTEALDGRAHELDPGRHQFKVESSGLPPLEREVLISRGEKGRLLTFEFPPPASERAAGTTTAGQGAAAPPPELPMHRPIPLVTYVLAGGAVVLAGTGGVLGYLGKQKHDDLAAEPDAGGCAPYCSEQDVQSVQSQLIAADVLFAAGAISATGALVTYFLRPEVPLAKEERKAPGAAGTWSVAAGLRSVAVRGSF